MRKVIDHGNAFDFATNLTTPADALTGGAGLRERGALDAAGIGGKEHGE